MTYRGAWQIVSTTAAWGIPTDAAAQIRGRRLEVIAMDPRTFDRLTRAMSDGTSRRNIVSGAAALLMSAFAPGAAGDAKTRRRQGTNRRVRAQAVCYSGSPCQVGPRANLARCDFSGSPALNGANCTSCNLDSANLARADARGATLKGANLGKACLVDADLKGANLSGANVKGAIFCRTTMPNGSVDNSGCANSSSCCPTCNVPAGGSCTAPGSICCDGTVCRNGVCSCRNGRTACDGVCVDTETDPKNCGECGHVCPDGQSCANGGCGGCPAGQEELSNGSCADPCDPGECPLGCFCSPEVPERPLNFYCTEGILSQLCFDSSECPPGSGCFSFRCLPLCGAA